MFHQILMEDQVVVEVVAQAMLKVVDQEIHLQQLHLKDFQEEQMFQLHKVHLMQHQAVVAEQVQQEEMVLPQEQDQVQDQVVQELQPQLQDLLLQEPVVVAVE